MKIRENVLLLFSKLPEPGLVKTRLSVLKDGIFSAEDACELYECMLLDVIGICLDAFSRMEGRASIDDEASAIDTYKLVVSTSPASNEKRMRDLLAQSGFDRDIVVISDSGATFDEHYNDAFDKVWEMGADCILSMGADMPALTANDVIRGFNELHLLEDADNGGIVCAPDQEMGVSIIGWTSNTEFDHTGVFYNQDGLTVLPAYIHKARKAGLPAVYLPPVPDIDTMADLAHNVTLVEALCYCAEYDGSVAPLRTAAKFAELGIDEVRVPPNNLMDPRDAIDGI